MHPVQTWTGLPWSGTGSLRRAGSSHPQYEVPQWVCLRCRDNSDGPLPATVVWSAVPPRRARFAALPPWLHCPAAWRIPWWYAGHPLAGVGRDQHRAWSLPVLRWSGCPPWESPEAWRPIAPESSTLHCAISCRSVRCRRSIHRPTGRRYRCGPRLLPRAPM